MVGLHFLKQGDTHAWVKNAKTQTGLDLTSSFETIGDILGEIVDCKINGRTPTLKYNEGVMKEAAHWNYVFVKRCIYKYINGIFVTFDQVENELKIEYPNSCNPNISTAKSDANCYITGLKLKEVCKKINEYLTPEKINKIKNPPQHEHHHWSPPSFFGLNPHVIFPRLSLRSCELEQWWQPAPPNFGEHGGPGGHHGVGWHHPPQRGFGPPPGGPPPPQQGQHETANYWFKDYLSGQALEAQEGTIKKDFDGKWYKVTEITPDFLSK